MKNKYFITIIILLLSNIYTSISLSNDEIIFDVTEIEILDNGNIINGQNGGKATTNNGLEIKADEFFYYKKKFIKC